MEAIFNLCKFGKYQIKVEDILDCYPEEDDQENLDYTFDHSVTLNAIYKVASDESKTLVTYEFIEHKRDDYNDEINPVSTFDMTADGLYEVDHMIIPTKDGINTESLLATYYYDNGKIYLKGSSSESDVAAILEMNLLGTNLVKSIQYTFQLSYLFECYYKIIRNLLNKLCPRNCSSEEYASAIQNRDLLWMGLNVIKYLIEEGKLYEAQSILEEFTGCASICSQTNNESGGKGCGCTK